jgi:UDP-glucuronate decarboxylase
MKPAFLMDMYSLIMDFLVTGGAGFIGSHLSRRLLADGHNVLCLDNLLTGSLDNISDLRNSQNFQFIEADVSEQVNIKVDGIFNLACPASPRHYQADPIRTMTTSFLGAKNTLDLAKQNSATILQASTSEIYGDPMVSPQDEMYWGNVNPFGIRSCYDEGKRAAETLFHDYFRRENVDIRVARIFNTFGPGMQRDDGRVVSNFICQALANEPISIYGDGSQTRSFCYVSDLIDGLVKLFFAKNVNTPVNLGNPAPISILNLAREIIDLTASESKIVFFDLPLDDPKQREPDISKAKELLGWSPVMSRTQGLESTIRYFRS